VALEPSLQMPFEEIQMSAGIQHLSTNLHTTEKYTGNTERQNVYVSAMIVK